MSTDDTDGPGGANWHRLLRIVGILVLAMAVGLSVGGVLVGYQMNQQTKRLDQVIACQTAYNQAVAAALEERSASAAQERTRTQELVEAEINMWLTLLRLAPQQPGGQTAEGRQKSIDALNGYLGRAQEYLRASRTAGEAREDNPLPTLNCRR